MDVVSSRAKQKAEARERRLAAERAREAAAHRRQVRILGVGLALMAAAAVTIVLVAAGAGSESPSKPATAAPQESSPFKGIPQDGASLGRATAPVVLTEFADLQCPFCRDYAVDVLPAVVEDYVRSGKVRLELRLLRFIGPDSDRGARAAHEAASRDRMWEFTDAFFRSQGAEGTGYADDDFIGEIARSAGLSPTRLLGAIEDGAHEKAIAAGEAEAKAYGIESTPSFVVKRAGGEAEVLAVEQLTPAAFRRALDAAL